MAAALCCRLSCRRLLLVLLCLHLHLAAAIYHPQETTLEPRSEPIVNNITGTPQIFDPNTDQPIPQMAASDGADVPLALWIITSALVGLPLAVAGVLGARFTTGAASGLSAAVLAWAAIINSISPPGLPDPVLTTIVMGFFAVGFILGALRFARAAGTALLAVTGGLAVGMRIVLLKDGLLFTGSLYPLNWVVIGLCGVSSGIAITVGRWRRAVVTLTCAFTGSFLLGLALDLAINQRTGMSIGLRKLFDRNNSHLADILEHPYAPSISTEVILVVSIVLSPILAYAQHRLFPAPFYRLPRDDDASDDINWGDEPISFDPNGEVKGAFEPGALAGKGPFGPPLGKPEIQRGWSRGKKPRNGEAHGGSRFSM